MIRVTPIFFLCMLNILCFWHCTAKEECQLPSLAHITTFLNDSLPEQQTDQEVMIYNYTFTCLAVGQIHQWYRHASVIVMYVINNTTVTSQFETTCRNDANNGTNEWMYNKTSFRNVSASIIHLITKEDCITCAIVNDHACVACPSICRGSGRCVNNSYCCPFYKAYGEECVESCDGSMWFNTSYTCLTNNENQCPPVKGTSGVSFGAFASTIVIFVTCIVVLSIILIILLRKLKTYQMFTKASGRLIKVIQESKTKGDSKDLKDSNIDKEDNHDYQPVDLTKRSIHNYKEFRKERDRKGESMPAGFPNYEDDKDYIDCRSRSKTLPTEERGEYVELDYQRSRKGKPRSVSTEDVDKARSLAVRKVQETKEEPNASVVYSYPRAFLAPPTLQEKKKKASLEIPEEDDDGYVQTDDNQKKNKKRNLMFAKQQSVDHEGYVDCEIVEEPRPKEKKPVESKILWFHKKLNKKKNEPEIANTNDDGGYVETDVKDMSKHENVVLSKQGSVDHEGYVDCEIIEEPQPEEKKPAAESKRSWHHIKKAKFVKKN